MSRSVNIVESPCKKFLQWDSDNSEFNYWDKARGEKGEKVEVKLPLRFLILDELATIKGYNEAEKSGIWSNEVRNTKKDELIVRTSKGIIAEGLYENIKDEVGTAGGKYTKSMYVGVANKDGVLEIWNLQLKGAAFSGWLEFHQKVRNKVYSDAVVCDGFNSEKKGKVTYTVPTFKLETITPEENDMAKELDLVLQDYLKYYFDRPKEPVEAADY